MRLLPLLLLTLACQTGPEGSSSTVAPAPAPAPATAGRELPAAPAAPAAPAVPDRARTGLDWMPSEPRELEPTVARARDAVLAGQAADAVPLLDARIAATSAPGAAADPDAWYWRGRARQAQQDPAGAEGDLRQAVALDPTWFAGRQQLADLLVSQRRCEEAVPLLLQQVESHPELAPAWTNLGFCRVRGEEPLVGLADLRKACSLGDARACEMVARAEARGAPAATP